MRILLASAHPYIPQIAGGAQSSTDALAVEFIRRGHPTAVVAGLTGHGRVGLKARIKLKLGRKNYVRDDGLGYPVFRAWFPWNVIAEVAREFQADAVVMQSGLPVRLAAALEGSQARRFIYLRNAESTDLGGDPSLLSDVSYIANSQFTAGWFSQNYGMSSTVVLPMIHAEKYRTETTARNVTFINPHKDKGVEIALRAVELCPDIPLTFVLAWTLSDDEMSHLKRKADELKNLTLRPATRDMKSVYGEARIVLAPSQWNEAFGRIAAEAHCSGIPVIGSNRGGLPEAIGPGGIVVDADAPAEVWAEAVKTLWNDADLWKAKSAASRAYAERPEMNPQKQIDMLLKRLSASQGREG